MVIGQHPQQLPTYKTSRYIVNYWSREASIVVSTQVQSSHVLCRLIVAGMPSMSWLSITSLLVASSL